MLPSERAAPRPPHPLDDPHLLLPAEPRVLQVPDVLQEALPEPAPRRQPRLRVLPERGHGEQQQARGQVRNRAALYSVIVVVTLTMCVRLRDEEALDAAHGQPCRCAPPRAAQVPIPRRAGEEPAEISASDVHEGKGRRNADKGECEFLGLEQLVDSCERLVDIDLRRGISKRLREGCGGAKNRTLAFWTWTRRERRRVPEIAERTGLLMSSS